MGVGIRLGYVSPDVTAHSHVFEFNEVLGLIKNGANVDYLSCRPIGDRLAGAQHDFAKPLQEISHGPSKRLMLRCGMEWLVRRTWTTTKLLARTTYSIIRQPSRSKQFIVSFALALQYASL